MWGDEVDEETRKDRVKGFFNALENQGTLAGLYNRFGIIYNAATDAANLNITLPDRSIFRLKDYVKVQGARTQWLWKERPRMAALPY